MTLDPHAFIEDARHIKGADPEHAFALWAVPTKRKPSAPPTAHERQAFEMVKVPRTGPSGYEPTGVLFWDQNEEMAINMACCINEEFGLGPDEAEQIVAENMARA